MNFEGAYSITNLNQMLSMSFGYYFIHNGSKSNFKNECDFTMKGICVIGQEPNEDGKYDMNCQKYRD
jgi:hypothetical protein